MTGLMISVDGPDDATGPMTSLMISFHGPDYPFGCHSVVELHIITSNNVGVF